MTLVVCRISQGRGGRLGRGHDQLELGLRFEEGVGVGVNLAKARALYRAAASNSGGTAWIYSPPAGNGDHGRVLPIKTGSRRPGLAEAKARLKALR